MAVGQVAVREVISRQFLSTACRLVAPLGDAERFLWRHDAKKTERDFSRSVWIVIQDQHSAARLVRAGIDQWTAAAQAALKLRVRLLDRLLFGLDFSFLFAAPVQPTS